MESFWGILLKIIFINVLFPPVSRLTVLIEDYLLQSEVPVILETFASYVEFFSFSDNTKVKIVAFLATIDLSSITHKNLRHIAPAIPPCRQVDLNLTF